MLSGYENGDIWNICLAMAIEGFNKGSMAISSVVLNERKEIIGTGRNHLNEKVKGNRIISNSSIAHAEVNAIHSIQEESLNGENLCIFTTVEPCPMCLGAIAMSRIRHITIGSKDPHAGSIKYLNDNKYVSKKDIKYTFEHGYIEKVFFSLHYLSICRVMKNRRPHIVFDNMRLAYHDIINDLENRVDMSNIDELVLDEGVIKDITK